MFALFIDTSATTKNFAILDEDRVISSYCYPSLSNTTNEPMFSWLRECIEKYALIFSNFTCIAVGYGPGPSFTGIRTGVAIASTLAYAYSLPLIGLCSLELYKPIQDSNNFYNISDARGQKLYYVEGKKNLITYEFTMPKIMNIHQWKDTVANNGIQITSFQHKFFKELVDKNLCPAIINWEYIIKKIFQEPTYLDPLFFTIPYFKDPR